MVVHNGLYIRARLVNFAVNEPLDVETAAPRIDRIAVEIKLENVGGGYEFGCNRTRQKIAIRIVIVSHADMTESIQNPLLGQNPVRRNQVFNEVGMGHIDI